jgi:hypothetical protein
LRQELDAFLAEAKPDERVAEAVRFIRRPGLPGLTGTLYPILFGGAVASLAPHHRELLGLRRPWWPAITLTRVLLWSATRVLGRMSPSERNARARIAGLAAAGDAGRAAADTPTARRVAP